MVYLIPAIFVALLLTAAAFDLRTYQIPNTVSVVLAAAFPVAVVLLGVPIDILAHVAAPVAILAVGLVLMHFGRIGGGDVKLLASVSLWFGIEWLPVYLVVVAIIGGVLAVVVVIFRKLRTVAGTGFAQNSQAQHPSATDDKIPYGLAISFGAILMLPWAPVFVGLAGKL